LYANFFHFKNEKWISTIWYQYQIAFAYRVFFYCFIFIVTANTEESMMLVMTIVRLLSEPVEVTVKWMLFKFPVQYPIPWVFRWEISFHFYYFIGYVTYIHSSQLTLWKPVGRIKPCLIVDSDSPKLTHKQHFFMVGRLQALKLIRCGWVVNVDLHIKLGFN